MPIASPEIRRWLVKHGKAHIAYEIDGEFTRSLCGDILRGGIVRTCSVRLMTGKCERCMAHVRKRAQGEVA